MIPKHTAKPSLHGRGSGSPALRLRLFFSPVHASAHSPAIAFLALLAFLAGLASPARSVTLPDGFVSEMVVSGLSNPTSMTFAPDGRLFITQKAGAVRVFKNGSLLATPFLTVTTDSEGERGVLGLAFHPGFPNPAYVYLYYTVPATATTAPFNRISRFTANGDTAVPGSEVVLLELDPLGHTGHNGGDLHFGSDGKLYAAIGDNHTRWNASNAGTLDNLLGKVLRLNPDGTIPADNPFYNQLAGNFRAIWAYGLRNPYRFAFQPGTGRMIINDVGENTWEELNDGAPGGNFGWPSTEGVTANPAYRSPLYVYPHPPSTDIYNYAYTWDTGCATTGGVFYNPTVATFPSSYIGKYFFADYCADWIHVYDPVSNVASPFASGIHYSVDGIPTTVDLDIGPDGSLYYMFIRLGGGGIIYRIATSAGNLAPSITSQPPNQTAAEGQTATFSVGASGTEPLSYQWRKNGNIIAGATATSYTTPPVTAADNGASYRCFVTNPYGTAISRGAVLTVTTDQAPVASITSPVAETLYAGGDIISFAGTASDPEDGTLPASAYTWRVDFHHATHVHPFLPDTTGITSGTFTIPSDGDTATDVWYRIYLTVRDSKGVATTVLRDVLPRKVTLTLASSPSGLSLQLEGQPATTPYAFQSVVGIIRQMSAPSPLTLGGTSYEFVSWSDGGAATHTITTPATNATYTATYRTATATAPVITTQPVSQTIRTSTSATFSVAASGSGTLGYQWQKNSVNITGANAASYTTPLAVASDNGSTYLCVVTSGGASTASSAATLTVVPPPTITVHPASQTVTEGQTATFSVTATGTGTLTYWWQRNGVSISGARSSSYTTPPVTATDNGAVYRCIVWNTINSVSNSIASRGGTLTVNSTTAPVITTQPVSQTIRTSTSATFSVAASGSGTLGYQWQKNSVNITGANAASYTTPLAVASDNGSTYRCIVTSGSLSTASSAATLTVVPPPTITVQPASQTVTEGQTATFSVTATGTGTLAYQWQRNGSNITGATSSTYTTPPVTATDNGAGYRCVVRNIVNFVENPVNSNTAVLTVNSTPPPNSPPTVSLTALGINAQGDRYAEITAQDTGDGLSAVNIPAQSNLTVTRQPATFPSGTKTPVKVIAARVSSNLTSQITVEAVDSGGLRASIAPVLLELGRDGNLPQSATLTGVPPAKHRIRLKNGAKGVSSLTIVVNGSASAPISLADNEERILDIDSAMTLSSNTVALSVKGGARSRIFLALYETPVDSGQLTAFRPVRGGRGQLKKTTHRVDIQGRKSQNRSPGAK